MANQVTSAGNLLKLEKTGGLQEQYGNFCIFPDFSSDFSPISRKITKIFKIPISIFKNEIKGRLQK